MIYIPATPEATAHRAGMDERVQRQLATYWRVRVTKTIERLETEARRMLALEEQLSAFAVEYYETVGDAAARLVQLDELINAQSAVPELDEVLAYREGLAARKKELKQRYRSIAKEIHPDRASVIDGAGNGAAEMHALNTAYERGDLAALLKLEAQLQLTKLCDIDFSATAALESALHEVNRAAETYAQGYRDLLNSPLNELMLRAMAANMEGWDFMQAVLGRIERAIEEREEELASAAAGALAQVAMRNAQAA